MHETSKETSVLSQQEQCAYSHELYLKLNEYKQSLSLNKSTVINPEDNASPVCTRYGFYSRDNPICSTKGPINFFTAAGDESDEELGQHLPK